MSTPAQYLTQPAQMTALSKEGVALIPSYMSPSQGLVLRGSPWNLPPTVALALNNLRFDGVRWTTQNIGWKQNRSALFNSGAAFLGFGQHYLNNGSSLFIQQVGKQIQLYDPTNSANPEIVLFTSAGGTQYPTFRSFSPNYFLYTSGAENPQVFDGTVWRPLMNNSTSPPPSGNTWPIIDSGGNTYQNPQYVESFASRACFAGFLGQPFAVLIADFNNPESVTLTGTSSTIGGIFFVPSQLGPITSLKKMRVSELSNVEALIVGCQNGLAFITGNDASSFQMVAVQQGRFGIPSNNIWFQIDDSLYGLCTDGIRPFNAQTSFANLISGSLSFPVQPLIKSMTTNWALRSQAFVLDNPGELEATFYYTSNSPTDMHNRTGLIMNYGGLYSNQFMFSQKVYPYETAYTPSTYLSPSCGIAYNGNYYTGGFNGILQTQYTNNTWNGTGINWNYLSPLVKANSPMEEAGERGFFILMDGTNSNFTASAQIWMGQALDQNIKSIVTTSQTKTTNTGGTTILGSWILGVSAFGGSQIQIIPYFPRGHGRAWQILLSGNTANADANLIGIYNVLTGGGTRQ